MSKFDRLNVQMHPEVSAKLRLIMAETGANATDVTDMAIRTLWFFYVETFHDKKDVHLHEKIHGEAYTQKVDLSWSNLVPRND